MKLMDIDFRQAGYRHSATNLQASMPSEFATAPPAIIVHHPIAVETFTKLEAVNDLENFQHLYLFETKPAPDLFLQQHQAFVRVLQANVPQVLFLNTLLGDPDNNGPQGNNPNRIYTRDPLITLPWIPDGYIAGCMKMPIRRPETGPLVEACRQLGLREIARLPDPLFLEGGDVIPFTREGRRTLLVGYGPRTTEKTVRHLGGLLLPRFADEIIGIQLGEWRINLDGGLVPVADDVLIAQPESIRRAWILDSAGEQPIDLLGMFRDLGFRIIDVSIAESRFQQACNCLCLGERKILCYDLSPRVYQELCRNGINAIRVPGSELVKGTGGPRCMTRPLYRKELVQPVKGT